MLVGLAALLLRLKFGIYHHILYFFVFAFAIFALLFHFHPALLLTIAALLVLPKTRGRDFKHAGAAGVGMLGYIFSLLLT